MSLLASQQRSWSLFGGAVLLLALLMVVGPSPAGASVRILEEDANGLVLEVDGLGTAYQAVSAGGQDWFRLNPQVTDLPWGRDTVIGQPDLPVLHLPLRMPAGSDLAVVSVDAEWSRVEPRELGLPLRPQPLQPSVSKDPAVPAPLFQYDAAWYSGRGAIGSAAETRESFQWRSARGSLVTLRPYRWDPSDGSLSLATRMRVRLSFEHARLDASRAELLRGRSPVFDDLAAAFFVNDDAYRASLGVLPNQGRWIPEVPIGYLIITADAWESALAPLVEWKTAKGFQVTVAKTSVIGSTAAAIQTYIRNAYQTWPVPPTYVLLVGDTDTMPAFTGSSSPTATDLYYVAVVGSDYFPEMMRGRISARNLTDIQTQINKVVNYEEATFPDDAWTRKACFMSSDDSGFHGVAEATNLYVINTYMIPSGVECDHIMAYYGGSTADVRNALNDGRMLAVYSGHGANTAWAGPSFSQNEVRNLTNGYMIPFVCSHACVTGTFSDLECFGETWVRVNNKGSVGFWGASNNTMWDEDDILERRMFDGLYTQHFYSVGGMTDRALLRLYQAYGGSGYSKYYFEAYNVLGDPSLDLWLQLPQTLTANHSSVLPIGTTSFDVTVLKGLVGQDSVLVCLRMPGQFQSTGYTNAQGEITLNLGGGATAAGLATLTVTAHNCRPEVHQIQLIVPSVVSIDPPSIPVGVSSAVTVTVEDTLGVGMAGVDVTISGWGVDPVTHTTVGDGTAQFTLLPPYGTTLSVVGHRPEDNYDLFTESLPVTGGLTMTGAITAAVPALGLSGQLTTVYEGILHGTSSLSGLTLYAHGCGVEASASDPGSAVDLSVVPAGFGTLRAALAKSGYNVVEEEFDVVPVFGTVTGTVRAAVGQTLLAGARLQAWPAGADTAVTPVTFTATTSGTGQYTVPDEQPCGYYDVYLSCFGYLNQVEAKTLLYGANVWDFQMASAPTGVVHGFIREDGTNLPLSGLINVYRTDTGSLYTTAPAQGDGSYTVTLPLFTYEFEAKAFQHVSESRPVTVDGPDQAQDFYLTPTAGNVLIVDDTVAKGSAEIFLATLTNLGYNVASTPVGSINPSQWSQYDVVVWSAGRNRSPVSEAAERTALQNWVSSGGKLLIEGGEIGADACSSPGYPTFAQDVLHCSAWMHGYGNLNRNLATHPLMTAPFIIPETLTHNYGADYGTQDGVGPRAEAQSVMTWTGGFGASLVAYDADGFEQNGGSTVYYAFEMAGIASTADRDHLIQNSIQWLLGSDPTAVEETAVLPPAFELGSPSPNPFGRETQLRLLLPATSQVRLEIFDVTGRMVARPFDGVLPAGSHGLTWDGTGADRALPGGVYWARVRWDCTTGHGQQSMRVVRLK